MKFRNIVLKRIAPLILLGLVYHFFIGAKHFNRLEFGDTTCDYGYFTFQISHFMNYGEIPSWDHYVIGGHNFLVNTFVNNINSPIFLGYLEIMRFIRSMGVKLDVHFIYKIYIVYICYFFIFIGGFYFLLKHLIKSKGAVLCTLLFVIFSGWSLSLLESQHNVLTAFMFIPWISLFFFKIFLSDKKAPVYIFFVQGFLLGQILYSGRMMIHAFFYITTFVFILLSYLLIRRIVEYKKLNNFVDILKKITRDLFIFSKRNAFNFFFLFCTFFIISLPVFLILPSLSDFYANPMSWGGTDRQVILLSEAVDYVPQDVVQYVYPIDTQGYYRMAQSAYVGSIGLFFIGLALFFSKNRKKYLFLSLFFALFYIGMGSNSWLYKLFFQFEIFRKTRWINYLFDYAALPLIVLIGYGIKVLLSNLYKTGRILTKKSRIYSLVLIVLIVVPLIVGPLSGKFIHRFTSLMKIIEGSNSGNWITFLVQLFGLLLLLILAIHLIESNISKKWRKNVFLSVLALLVFSQLMMNYNYTSNYFRKVNYWKPYSLPPLREEDRSLPRDASFEPFISYLSKQYRITTCRGYLTVYSKVFSELNLVDLTNKKLLPFYKGIEAIPDVEIRNKVLHKPIIGQVKNKEIINTFYKNIIQRQHIDLNSSLDQIDHIEKDETALIFPFSAFKLQSRDETSGIKIYELNHPDIPYYYSTNFYSDTGRYISVSIDNKPLRQTWYNDFFEADQFQLNYEKAKTLIISLNSKNRPQEVAISFRRILSDIEIEEFRGDYLRFKVDTREKRFLYFEIFNDKYWQAKIDQVPGKIEMLEGGFMGINLSPGLHTVELSYNVDFVKYYLKVISVATYIFLLLVTIVHLFDLDFRKPNIN